MAQRNNPARRVPDNPLAGIVRMLNQQSRYAQRRRSGVPTVTSLTTPDMAAETIMLQSAAEAATSGEPGVAAPLAGAPPVAARAGEGVAPQVSAATAVATQVATVTTGDTGSAKLAFGPFADRPVVQATVAGFGPVLAVIENVSQDGATIVAYDIPSGARAAGAEVHVTVSGTPVS